jgi:hypothetical protein
VNDYQYMVIYLDYASLAEEEVAAKLNVLGSFGWRLVVVDSHDRAYLMRAKA